ncbi:MAG: hypothetical protein SAJ37_15550 [Oscillatoria sp. PMC 1068.18]|nr:hypothetical protein [Oscillatoria sp. PMC 1076.18]MEC4990148.1 hypothetical protein [Oscillatoria sp. PMC 1068.18]
MLLSDIKQSRFYQEAFQEGEKRVKLAVVPAMLSLGASVEDIAEVLAMDVEEVRELAQNQPQSDSGDEN